jgi:hypothetical protein
MEEHWLRMFENRGLRKIFGLERSGEDCIMTRCIIFTFQLNIIWVTALRAIRGTGHVAHIGEGEGWVQGVVAHKQ